MMILGKQRLSLARILTLFSLLCAASIAAPVAVIAVTPIPKSDSDYNESNATIFREGELPVIEITMSQAVLESLLADPWGDEYVMCRVRFQNSVIDETADSVGIRVRGNTSRQAIKKSWKLSFNAFVPGRKFHGLEKFNLNGEHNDVSIIRSKLAWDLFKEMQIPSSRAGHVRLTINDGSIVDGVFIHIEQVDEEFTDAWFGNKTGNLYKCLYKNERADLRYVEPGTAETYENYGWGETYDEQNQIDPDYTDLAELIDFINHSNNAEFVAGIAGRFSIDNFLRSTAIDVLIGNWDNYWYGANNYYLYHNPETDRFEYIPYDLDNTYGVDFFGIDWAERPLSGWGDNGFGSTGGECPPLIQRILNTPAFEAQIRRYLLELVNGPFRLVETEAAIDSLHAMIGAYAFEGSFDHGNMDWGYTTAMFHESYTFPEEYRNWDWGWDYGLKPFIEDRTNFILQTIAEPPALPSLFINEFLAANSLTNTDEWGDFDDWVEIYNGGSGSLNLGGLSLTDDLRHPFRFIFPDTLLPAGAFLLVWCDGEAHEGDLHTSFKLSAAGEDIGLYSAPENGSVPLDFLSFDAQTTDVSFGRESDGADSWIQLANPTPGTSNDSSDVPDLIDPKRFLILSSHPNPTRAGFTIDFNLPDPRLVQLRILSIDGRLVAEHSIRHDSSGRKSIVWDGRSAEGRKTAPGVYLYQLTAGKDEVRGRVLILR
ncbi:MAG: CotH kinase family protein [Candidatus Eisenbacteria bacterium]|nr:CotH kinase family protein [Candidatus Eisenbacteria bacterium]